MTTVEISPERKARAERSLAEYDNVDVIEGDAVRGWEAAAPYDAIAVTGSLPVLDEVFLRQLKPGGRLFVVVGEAPAMEARLVTRTGARDFATESLFETVLPPLAGARAPQPVRILKRTHGMYKRSVFPSLYALAAAALVAATPMAASGQALDLTGAYRLAAENDPAFLAARATRDASLESVALARAFLRPSVSFTGSARAFNQDVDPEPRASGGGGGEDETYTIYSLSLDLRYPLWRPDQLIRLGQARTNEEKAEVDYAVRAQQLVERVVVGYFGVLEAGDSFRFAETNREAIGQQLRQAQQRFEVGLIAITDVEEAKARFDLASARAIEAENALGNAREAMREIIGEYPEALASLGEGLTLAVPDPADIDEWSRTAAERNLLVQSASFSVALASENIRLAARGGRAGQRWAPSLDLVGSAGYTDRDQTRADTESNSASVGIELRWPLYTGGGLEADVREARARHREAMHIQERARREAVRLTRQAYLGVESAIARVGALRQAVVSSQSALDAVEAGFQVGTRTSVDVLDAQRDLFQAQNDLAAARYDYIRNALRLRLAAGTLVPADLDAINGWLE